MVTEPSDAQPNTPGPTLGQLISAVRAGDRHAAKMHWDSVAVLDEDELTACGSDGLSVLGLACQLGDVDMVSMLLQHPLVDPNKARRTTTNLMIAAGRGYADIARALLAHPRCDANLKRRDGVTALLLSVQEGHREMTRALLQHPRTRPSVKALLPERLTPLVLAIRQQNAQQVALLLQCDRLLMSENVWMRETPLEFARSLSKQSGPEAPANTQVSTEQCPLLSDQDSPHQPSSIHSIVGMLEAFEDGGCQRVAEMVQSSDRLFDPCINKISSSGKNAGDFIGFAYELGLCKDLLQCQLSPEARVKVEELEQALRGRQALGTENNA